MEDETQQVHHIPVREDWLAHLQVELKMLKQARDCEQLHRESDAAITGCGQAKMEAGHGATLSMACDLAGPLMAMLLEIAISDAADVEIAISDADWIMMASPNEAQLTGQEAAAAAAAANAAVLVDYVLGYFGPACDAHSETAPVANKEETHGETAPSTMANTPILAADELNDGADENLDKGGGIPFPDAEHDGDAIHINGPTKDEAMAPNNGDDHDGVDGDMPGVPGKTTGVAGTNDIIQYLFVTDH
jgi:hypothetical protein